MKNRKDVIEEIYKLIKKELGEEGKNLTVDYVIGILDEARTQLESRTILLPVKLVIKD